MRITINRFTFLLPNGFIGFALRKVVINKGLFLNKTEKQVKDLSKLIQKELIEFKKRNGKIVLVEVKDSDGTRVKIVI